MTNIQVRSVDERLARLAKERAARTHRSLSDYVKDLIRADLAAEDDRSRFRALLSEIAQDEDPPVDPEETLAAVREARRAMGVQ